MTKAEIKDLKFILTAISRGLCPDDREKLNRVKKFVVRDCQSAIRVALENQVTVKQICWLVGSPDLYWQKENLIEVLEEVKRIEKSMRRK